MPACEGIITCLQPHKHSLEHRAQPVPPRPQESNFAPSICQPPRAVNCRWSHRVLLAVSLSCLLVRESCSGGSAFLFERNQMSGKLSARSFPDQ